MKLVIGQIYYWLSYAVNFVLPFILLFVMNCFIIKKLPKSRQFIGTTLTNQGKGQRQFHEGQSDKGKLFEKQTYIILLSKIKKNIYIILFLVTFGFLILVTPSYLCYI